MDGIWFHAAEKSADFEKFGLDQKAQFAVIPEINRFRGRSTLNLRVKERRNPDQILIQSENLELKESMKLMTAEGGMGS